LKDIFKFFNDVLNLENEYKDGIFETNIEEFKLNILNKNEDNNSLLYYFNKKKGKFYYKNWHSINNKFTLFLAQNIENITENNKLSEKSKKLICLWKILEILLIMVNNTDLTIKKVHISRSIYLKFN